MSQSKAPAAALTPICEELLEWRKGVSSQPFKAILMLAVKYIRDQERTIAQRDEQIARLQKQKTVAMSAANSNATEYRAQAERIAAVLRECDDGALVPAQAYADAETDGERGEVWENMVNDYCIGWQSLRERIRAALQQPNTKQPDHLFRVAEQPKIWDFENFCLKHRDYRCNQCADKHGEPQIVGAGNQAMTGREIVSAPVTVEPRERVTDA